LIVMAADYVGYHIVKFLCSRNEKIEIFVYDSADRGNYNERMIDMVKSLEQNTTVYAYEELKDPELLQSIRDLAIDFGVLAWWPYIIPKAIIQLTKRGFANTHPGYLPYNRGKHPSFWSIVEGTPFGVTLHYVDQEIDNGPIIAQKEIPITWLDTGETLYNQAREEMLSLFYDSFDRIKENSVKISPQSKASGSFHLGKELEPASVIDIDKEYSAKTLLNIIRGRVFNGQGSANFTDGGKQYFITISIRTDDKS
jgi:methionyl-tRNA formyltransferase